MSTGPHGPDRAGDMPRHDAGGMPDGNVQRNRPRDTRKHAGFHDARILPCSGRSPPSRRGECGRGRLLLRDVGVDRALLRRFRSVRIHRRPRRGGRGIGAPRPSPAEGGARHGGRARSRHRKPHRMLSIDPHGCSAPMGAGRRSRRIPGPPHSRRPARRLLRGALRRMDPRKRALGSRGIPDIRNTGVLLHDSPDTSERNHRRRQHNDASADRTVRHPGHARSIEGFRDASSDRPCEGSRRADAGPSGSRDGYSGWMVPRDHIVGRRGDVRSRASREPPGEVHIHCGIDRHGDFGACPRDSFGIRERKIRHRACDEGDPGRLHRRSGFRCFPDAPAVYSRRISPRISHNHSLRKGVLQDVVENRSAPSEQSSPHPAHCAHGRARRPMGADRTPMRDGSRIYTVGLRNGEACPLRLPDPPRPDLQDAPIGEAWTTLWT